MFRPVVTVILCLTFFAAVLPVHGVYVHKSPRVLPDGVTVKKLISDLKNEDAKDEAVIWLKILGREAKQAAPALAAAIKDAAMKEEDREFGVLAALALMSVDPARSKEALAVIVAGLEDTEDEVLHVTAALALMALGPKAKETAPRLKKALEDDLDLDQVCFYAKVALIHMESGSLEKAVTELDDAFKKLDGDEDDHFLTGVAAADGLAFLAMESKEALRCLITGLKDKKPTVRSHAARALGDVIGPGARQALEPLESAVKDPDKKTRLQAGISLALLDPTQLGRTVAQLKSAFRDPDAEIRIAALTGLDDVYGRTDRALPCLMLGLEDHDREIRDSTINVLVERSEYSAAVVPALILALKNPNANVRHAAAGGLRDIGPRAAAALPALRSRAKDDPDHMVREAAAEAVRRIGQQRHRFERSYRASAVALQACRAIRAKPVPACAM